MKSPFPGMDPYLERRWRGVHLTLIAHAQAVLNGQLAPGSLRARVDERLVIEEPWGGAPRSVYPDVLVVERGTANRAPAGGTVAVAEPLVIAAPEPLRERYIEILDTADGNRVVTVVEFLSPTNKLAGDGRDQYLRKQRDVIAAGVNLVEVDLTRGGRRELAYPESALPPGHRATYAVCAYRGFRASRFEVYALPLRERLPAVRVPLRPGDADAVLDLQALVDRAYTDGGHDDIDYAKPCDPPLSADDAAWVASLVAGRSV
ncbi:MAG TPA: DUF4058 family protein [Tepidisphaeraceae bacterium]|nr:DUF4058 family protein [Tepidisphaeraceae bacterium]